MTHSFYMCAHTTVITCPVGVTDTLIELIASGMGYTADAVGSERTYTALTFLIAVSTIVLLD